MEEIKREKGSLQEGKSYTSDEVNDLLEWKEEILAQEQSKRVAELRKDAWERLGNIKVILRDDKEVMLKELATFKLRFDELFGCEKPSSDELSKFMNKV